MALDMGEASGYAPRMQEGAEILARLSPSPARRFLAVAFTGGLGLLCMAVVLLRPPAEPVWIIVLLALGAAALWLARRLATATRTSIELTRRELRDGQGRTLAAVDRIEGVERGVFAFKPSNGFLVRLSEPAERAWQPGLWWRLGRRVGVGGVTPSAQGRVMADTLTALLVERGRKD